MPRDVACLRSLSGKGKRRPRSFALQCGRSAEQIADSVEVEEEEEEEEVVLAILELALPRARPEPGAARAAATALPLASDPERRRRRRGTIKMLSSSSAREAQSEREGGEGRAVGRGRSFDGSAAPLALIRTLPRCFSARFVLCFSLSLLSRSVSQPLFLSFCLSFFLSSTR